MARRSVEEDMQLLVKVLELPENARGYLEDFELT